MVLTLSAKHEVELKDTVDFGSGVKLIPTLTVELLLQSLFLASGGQKCQIVDTVAADWFVLIIQKTANCSNKYRTYYLP